MPTRAERIDAVPWARLRQADGSAEDLRPLLHAMFDPSAEVARAAVARLGAKVCVEEYAVDDATLAALPFLVEAFHEAEGDRRADVGIVIGDVARAITPHADPWRGLRALPGSERLLFQIAVWRDDQAAAAPIRRALLEAMPVLLARESSLVWMAAALARAPEGFGPSLETLLVEHHDRATGPRRLRLLRALADVGAIARVAEPDDECEHWVWLASDPARAARLAPVVLEASAERIAVFDAAWVGRGFFVDLGAPLVLARPDLQPAVARRLARHLVARAAGSDSPYRRGVGPAEILLAFPGATLPARPEGHQIDLLELAYRAAFLPGTTNGHPLDPIKGLGAPWLRERASTYLVSQGRAPLP